MNTKADTTERQAMTRDTDQSEDLRIVEAATQGEWRAHITRRRSPEIYTNGTPANTSNPLIARGVIRKLDATFIAHFDPPKILSMLNKEKAQAEEIGRLREELAEALAEQDSLRDRTIERTVRAQEAEAEVERLKGERDFLQEVLDGRPAINAGLPANYIRWSQSIYSGDAIKAALSTTKGAGA